MYTFYYLIAFVCHLSENTRVESTNNTIPARSTSVAHGMLQLSAYGRWGPCISCWYAVTTHEYTEYLILDIAWMQNAVRLRVCSESWFALLYVRYTSIGNLILVPGTLLTATLSVRECYHRRDFSQRNSCRERLSVVCASSRDGQNMVTATWSLLFSPPFSSYLLLFSFVISFDIDFLFPQ